VFCPENVQYGGVYRAHRMQLLTGAIAHKDEVEVVSWVSRVALRSYDLTHEMRRASDQTVLAYITSTRVMILDGRAAPLPHYDRLKQIVQPIETKTACESVTSPRPANAFVLPMLVRQSDVDTQGHINNAKYMFLMEDAKNAAVQSGALPKAYAKLSTAEVYIQYNGTRITALLSFKRRSFYCLHSRGQAAPGHQHLHLGRGRGRHDQDALRLVRVCERPLCPLARRRHQDPHEPRPSQERPASAQALLDALTHSVYTMRRFFFFFCHQAFV